METIELIYEDIRSIESPDAVGDWDEVAAFWEEVRVDPDSVDLSRANDIGGFIENLEYRYFDDRRLLAEMDSDDGQQHIDSDLTVRYIAGTGVCFTFAGTCLDGTYVMPTDWVGGWPKIQIKDW